MLAACTTQSDPKEIIARLKDEIRGFWAAHERKFIEVWKLLEKDGKTKFAKACVQVSSVQSIARAHCPFCVQACSSLSPQAELLFPEITVEQIVEGVRSSFLPATPKPTCACRGGARVQAVLVLQHGRRRRARR